MELLFETDQFRKLLRIIDNTPKATKRIKASIAFSSSEVLLKKVIENKIELEWYGLFDEQESTAANLIEKALDNKKYIKFYPIIDYFHSKVIYFENYGIFIGSSNMTKSALFHNIEAGVFIDWESIESNDEYKNKINEYFNFLNTLSTPFTDEDFLRYREFLANNSIHQNKMETENFNKEAKRIFKETFSNYFAPTPGAMAFTDKDNDSNSYKKEFIREWSSTQHELMGLMKIFKDRHNIPAWINNYDNIGIIADQFLHAYYYSMKHLDDKDAETNQSSLERINAFYELNRNNKDEALNEALDWWRNLSQAPSNEDIHINEWAVLNEALLSKNKILNLTEKEFVNLLLHNHSAREHARQLPAKLIGLYDGATYTKEQRTEAFAKYLFHNISLEGNNILQVLYYLLYNESVNDPIENRVFNTLFSPKYKIEHLGKSITGELIGWSNPTKYPIRNNRVNKALRALGYDVTLN